MNTSELNPVLQGYNRKYAIPLLNRAPPDRQGVKRPRGRKSRQGKPVISILMTVWKAAGYLVGAAEGAAPKLDGDQFRLVTL